LAVTQRWERGVDVLLKVLRGSIGLEGDLSVAASNQQGVDAGERRGTTLTLKSMLG